MTMEIDLIKAVIEMRIIQKEFFACKTNVNLERAIRVERLVDRFLAEWMDQQESWDGRMITASRKRY